MKHVLLALGIVLVAAGAAAMVWGYGIIEDDRGSASFIVGGTALTGGVIVAALSFVLGALQRLQAAWEAQGVPALPATADLPPPAREEAPAAQREEPVFASRAANARSAERPLAPPAAAAPPPHPTAEGISRASSAFMAAAAKAQRSDPSINDLWRRVGVNLETAKPDKTASRTNDRQESHPAAQPDWLDEALAGFGEPVAPKSRQAEAPPLAPNVPEQPEIIGRYEVEGTEYVMYADGAIDALTQDGVLRFKSMAELRAFFQG